MVSIPCSRKKSRRPTICKHRNNAGVKIIIGLHTHQRAYGLMIDFDLGNRADSFIAIRAGVSF